MVDFPGFGVSGYRTLSGDVQWIPLDRAITVFLGGNNSGKSNILRLMELHMGGIFRSLSEGATLSSFDSRLDAPRDSGEIGLRVLRPLDVDAVLESSEAVRHDLKSVLERPELNQQGFVSLPFETASLIEPLRIDLRLAQALTESSVGAINWQHMSSTLAGMSGGHPGEDAQRVLTYLRAWCVPPPEVVLVPPWRALRGGGTDSGEWNFSGDGMVFQLQRLKSPLFDEEDHRKRAEALTRDLRELLEDDGLEFEVPHDLSTVNIQLRGTWFPLESLGTGTEHAVVILAARHVYPERLLCLEEPDAHLHPRLQRRLVSLLRDAEGRQVAIATHSAHMIDAADTVVAVRLEGTRSSVAVVGDHTLFEALRALGYRASDLLQTNCIVWAEGPSDRIYLLHWLRAIAPELIEGIDFSIVFYGGALLARLSAMTEALDDPTLVDLWRINRRMWVLMDADRGGGELKPAVQRLQTEIAEAGAGGTWVTRGYTIENYIDPGVLEEAVRSVHPSVERIVDKSSTVDPLANLVRADGEPFSHVDKVAVALAVCEVQANLDVLDLTDRVSELADFIREVSPETVVPVVDPAALTAD
jgi:energy-coupling factor transporter ATP-binding protein EcfA2